MMKNMKEQDNELRNAVAELIAKDLFYSEKLDEFMQLLSQYGDQRELAGREWNEVRVDDESTYPPYNQEVLARMTYDNNKYEPIYIVVKHVDEDDCDWRTSDGDELSYWVNITHWQTIAELKVEEVK